jgi:hypothetical protein
MTANAGLALFRHEGIGLQLGYQFRVALLAYAQRGLVRYASCDIAMAHGALDIIRAMRPGFPFGIRLFMAARTLFSGGNLLMAHLRRLTFCLGDRWLDGGGRNEQDEQDRTEQIRAKSVHGQSPEHDNAVSDLREPPYGDAGHVSP